MEAKSFAAVFQCNNINVGRSYSQCSMSVTAGTSRIRKTEAGIDDGEAGLDTGMTSDRSVAIRVEIRGIRLTTGECGVTGSATRAETRSGIWEQVRG